MAFGGRRVTQEAEEQHAADVALAAKFGELLDEARRAEGQLRQAQGLRQAGGIQQVPGEGVAQVAELHQLGEDFDTALTEVMRAAYAAERAAIGARGYDDRIYRRKAKATAEVKRWTAEAEALLTMREAHRLGGIVRVPRVPVS